MEDEKSPYRTAERMESGESVGEGEVVENEFVVESQAKIEREIEAQPEGRREGRHEGGAVGPTRVLYMSLRV